MKKIIGFAFVLTAPTVVPQAIAADENTAIGTYDINQRFHRYVIKPKTSKDIKASINRVSKNKDGRMYDYQWRSSWKSTRQVRNGKCYLDSFHITLDLTHKLPNYVGRDRDIKRIWNQVDKGLTSYQRGLANNAQTHILALYRAFELIEHRDTCAKLDAHMNKLADLSYKDIKISDKYLNESSNYGQSYIDVAVEEYSE